jgi:8-oxo-dGTP pyrophosphatase MutT (NUDIX family)
VIVTRRCPASRRLQAVLVRGRYSYEFAEFVHGRYSAKNAREVAALLDAMSVHERLDVYSLDFAQMWFRVWLTADQRELYNLKFAKFHGAWIRDDGGERLRRLVLASRLGPGGGRPREGGLRWEFPKGRRLSRREPDLNCAIREFEEETGIAKRAYQLFPGFHRRVDYIHMGVRYVNVYYVAHARREVEPGLDLRTLSQVAEVSEVRWMGIEQIRLVDTPTRRLERTVAPAFRYVKRRLRGRAPACLPPPRSRRALAASQERGARAPRRPAARPPSPPTPRRREERPVGVLPASLRASLLCVQAARTCVQQALSAGRRRGAHGEPSGRRRGRRRRRRPPRRKKGREGGEDRREPRPPVGGLQAARP